VIRLVVALGLTVLGFAWPVPYAGYAFSLLWFAPAAALEIVAIAKARDRGSCIVGLLLFALTAVGLFLGVLSAIDVVSRTDRSVVEYVPFLAVVALFTLIAAIVARIRRRQ
jgi:hypothetical protein